MKYLALKIWFLVTITLALSAAIIRLVWEGVVNPSAGTLTFMSLVILVSLGAYALSIYLTIKPTRETLKSLPVVIGFTIIITGGLIGTILHYVRFVPSPPGEPFLSKVIASLLFLAMISLYLLLLWVFWTLRKTNKS